MRTLELDGRKMDTRAQAHAHIAQALSFPDYYGNNLDALRDCLLEMPAARIVLRHPAALRNALGDYGAKMVGVFRDAARERPGLSFHPDGEA